MSKVKAVVAAIVFMFCASVSYAQSSDTSVRPPPIPFMGPSTLIDSTWTQKPASRISRDSTPPKPSAKTEKPMCIDIPKFGSHIKDHVCMAADADNARQRFEQLRMLYQTSATNSLGPVPSGQSTTTPIQ